MITKYEVTHCGRVKRFDTFEEAVRLGSALEKLGYLVKVSMTTTSLYTTITTVIYQTSKLISQGA